MLFRSIMFGSFAQIKTWLATNKDGSTRQLKYADFYKVTTSTSQTAITTLSHCCILSKTALFVSMISLQ